MGLLDDVHVKLAKDDRAGALDVLLEAWVEAPSIAVADAIDALDALLAQPAFTGAIDTWTESARQPKPFERGPRIRAITGQTMTRTVAMLRRAHKWRDPRLTHVLADLLQKLPWSGAKSRDTWREVFDVIGDHGDARFVAIAKTLPATWTVGKPLQKWLAKHLAEAVERIPLTEPDADEDAIAALAASLRARVPVPEATPHNTESLLAAIYANPSDDAPRAIYADWLQERGDPRGEFIALQLAGANTKAERSLLRKHKKEWLGPLANAMRGEVEFRRGFPAAGVVTFRHQRDVEQFGSLAEWATVEELEYSNAIVRFDQEVWAHYLGPAHRNLRIARRPAIQHLLATTTPWHLENLELDAHALDNIDSTPLEMLLASSLLPKLRRFGLTGRAQPMWLRNITTLPETLAVYSRLEDQETIRWLAALDTNPRCTTLELYEYGGVTHRLHRDRSGAFSQLITEIIPSTKAATIDDQQATYHLAHYRKGLAALRSRHPLTDVAATIVIAGNTVAVS